MNIKPWRMQVLSFCNSNLWGRKGHGTVSQVIPADRTMSMTGWIGFTGNVIDCTLLSHALLAVRRKLDWAEEVLSGIINLSLNRKSGTYTKLKKLLECNCCRQRTLHKHKNVIYPWHYISCLFVGVFLVTQHKASSISQNVPHIKGLLVLNNLLKLLTFKGEEKMMKIGQFYSCFLLSNGASLWKRLLLAV